MTLADIHPFCDSGEVRAEAVRQEVEISAAPCQSLLLLPQTHLKVARKRSFALRSRDADALPNIRR